MASKFLRRASALVALAVAVSGLTAAFPAAAQNLPPGSYGQSCFNLQLIDGTLIGNCRRGDGSIRGTSLPHAWHCHGDIANENGKLRCIEVVAPQPRVPNGSYLQNCINPHVVDGELFADCRKLDGYMRPSRLPAPWSCPGDIADLDGHLRCVVR
jgi:hypothetical protein